MLVNEPWHALMLSHTLFSLGFTELMTQLIPFMNHI